MEGEDSGLDREGVCECLNDHVCVIIIVAQSLLKS